VAAVAIALLVVLFPVSSHAADNTTYNLPWEKFSIQGGAFFAALNNQVTVGSEGAGVAVDLEQALGLDSQSTVFRLGTLYRIGEKRRHRVDLDYLYFNRDSTKTLGGGILVDNVSLAAGTLVETTFNYQIIRAAYSYSFFQDDRMDLAGSFGLFVMPIKFEMSASGLGSSEGDFNFTAPLPAFGLRGDFAITPRWMLRTNLDFFYLEYDSFRGALVDARVAVEYNPWDHFGFGLGLDSFKLKLSAEDEDYPSVDFQGNIKSQFFGVQLYARYFF
ncbi:MAG: hypothetical protein H6R41_1338, partial [Deltaproteobacteria bacterium]|nr:hypothetical protein [Deltaproteobacteria bacterium]